VLTPAIPQLDTCWWYLGGAGASLGPTVSGKRPLTEKRFATMHEEYQRAADEYALWVDTDLAKYGIGIPGFFSRYGSAIQSNWVRYFASDAAEAPVTSFDQVEALRIGWFDPPPPLPNDICLYVRDIDSAYWDLFFRDEWMHDAVFEYLLRSNLNPHPFTPLSDHAQSRRRSP
jgi:hypothetical protein